MLGNRVALFHLDKLKRNNEVAIPPAKFHGIMESSGIVILRAGGVSISTLLVAQGGDLQSQYIGPPFRRHISRTEELLKVNYGNRNYSK